MLIVGAGPAGSELAWRLAQNGISVLLVDGLPDLRQAAFSSAALPWSALVQHGLPERVVAARWHGWRLLGPGSDQREWRAEARVLKPAKAAGQPSAPLGAVLDFGALRHWLAERAQLAGCTVQLGWRAVRWQPEGNGARTLLRGPGGVEQWVSSAWLVDATGQQRALLGDPPKGRDALVCGGGVEWLLQVPHPCWLAWADRLSFLLGSDWVPQGYGWVFPMQPGQLKVGVCRLDDPSRAQPPLSALLRQLLKRLDLDQHLVLDRHGGLIRSTIHRREAHQRGALIGLGDAVSTANLLGGEGIRHALSSAAVLAPLLLQALQGRPRCLRRYPLDLRHQLGWRWSLSGRLARRTWLSLHSPAADRRLQRLLQGLEHSADAQALSGLLFDYRFERYGVRALPYLLGWR